MPSTRCGRCAARSRRTGSAFLAHVLVMRDGCTNENCKAFALLRDPGQVRANLSGETFKHYLEHYLPVWAKASDAHGHRRDAGPDNRDDASKSARPA